MEFKYHIFSVTRSSPIQALLRELFFLMYGWEPPHQIRGENFQIYILSYRQVLRIIFHFLWQSETTQITTKNFPYFSYQKFVSQKQGKITTKNFAYFLIKKMSFKNNVNLLLKIQSVFLTKKLMYVERPPFHIRAENIFKILA